MSLQNVAAVAGIMTLVVALVGYIKRPVVNFRSLCHDYPLESGYGYSYDLQYVEFLFTNRSNFGLAELKASCYVFQRGRLEQKDSDYYIGPGDPSHCWFLVDDSFCGFIKPNETVTLTFVPLDAFDMDGRPISAMYDKHVVDMCKWLALFYGQEMVVALVYRFGHRKKVLYYGERKGSRRSSRFSDLELWKTYIWYKKLKHFGHGRRLLPTIPEDAVLTYPMVMEGMRSLPLKEDDVVFLDNMQDPMNGFYRWFLNENNLCNPPCGRSVCILNKMRYSKYSNGYVRLWDDRDSVFDIDHGMSASELEDALDKNSSRHFELLSEATYVVTCVDESFSVQYVRELLSSGKNFKILGVRSLYERFENELSVDGDFFIGQFYVPFDFDLLRRCCFFSDRGEPMVYVKDCCWLVPKQSVSGS